MSGLQDVTNENDHFWLISILHGQEAEEFRDWLDRTQLSRDDERWIVALLKSKYREGRREVCKYNSYWCGTCQIAGFWSAGL